MGEAPMRDEASGADRAHPVRGSEDVTSERFVVSENGEWEFWTIEVTDPANDQATRPGGGSPGRYSARAWKDAYGEALIEAAITHGAKEWAWVIQDWGVLLELGFADEEDWLRFRATPAVSAALDAVPDPVNGLFVYPGRGGSNGSRVPRRPRPRPIAEGPIPEPDEPPRIERPLGQYITHPEPTRAMGDPLPDPV
jgi:hypothetical protein